MSDNINNTIAIRFSGGDIHPETVKARELAEVIRSIEDALVALSGEEYNDIDKDDLFIGLTTIQDQSLGLQFEVSLPSILRPAWYQIGSAIRDGLTNRLPASVLVHLRTIAKFVERRKCQAELYVHGLGSELVATITRDTDFEVPPPIEGVTTLYGLVLRVGGYDQPTVFFRTIDGSGITCHIDRSNRSLAKRLGSRLYTMVGLSGIGFWNAETLELIDFKAEEILPYDEEVSVTAIFEDLAQRYGQYFEDIDDVPEYIAALRNDDLED